MQRLIIRISLVHVILTMTLSTLAQEVKISLFRESGLDCDWDKSGSDRIAYSRKGADGYYDIYITDPESKSDTCLTCDHPLLPNRHIAAPAWHPSGDWILFLAEKKIHKRSSTHALPGFGAYCDIWIISSNGKKTYKLIEIPNDYSHGVIHPCFSNNGNKIVWTHRIKKPVFLSARRTFGYWDIKLASFRFGKDSVPEISIEKTIRPGGISFYECYGFSPDDSRLIFCSSMNRPSVWDQQIYTIDTSGNNLQCLTEKNYNEHGQFTPDGKFIVWMSNEANKNKGTDWWIMNVDGTNKRRLTFMNKPGHEHYQGKAVWAGLISFSPDGKKFVGGMQVSLITQEGKIWLVNIK